MKPLTILQATIHSGQTESIVWLPLNVPLWFFLDESTTLHGPFDTEAQARMALDGYCVVALA